MNKNGKQTNFKSVYEKSHLFVGWVLIAAGVILPMFRGLIFPQGAPIQENASLAFALSGLFFCLPGALLLANYSKLKGSSRLVPDSEDSLSSSSEGSSDTPALTLPSFIFGLVMMLLGSFMLLGSLMSAAGNIVAPDSTIDSLWIGDIVFGLLLGALPLYFGYKRCSYIANQKTKFFTGFLLNDNYKDSYTPLVVSAVLIIGFSLFAGLLEGSLQSSQFAMQAGALAGLVFGNAALWRAFGGLVGFLGLLGGMSVIVGMA